MSKTRYLYTSHASEGIGAFCYQGPVNPSRRQRLPVRRIPYRSAMLPSIQDQDGFFTAFNATPTNAAAQWVDHPVRPLTSGFTDPT